MEFRKLVRLKHESGNLSRNRIISLPFPYLLMSGIDPERELKGKWKAGAVKGVLELYIEYLD